ncbi:hypothetical protein JW872_00290 [Candidatus Babeliales bacterium]|nr:hypothetical protein [Candidatus Babeliales bacterium]
MNTLFGTDGIRNKVGYHPFTRDALAEFGNALGLWITQKYGPQIPVLLGYDTRKSCAWVKAALQSGLLLHQISLYDADILPTPAVFKNLRTSKKFKLGIVISASHNPYDDNGIKIFDLTTGKLTHEDEQTITDLFYNAIPPAYDSFGTITTYRGAQKQYIDDILKYCSPTLTGKTIVLDCAHGATSLIAPYIFTACGARVIALNNEPNGTNINANCGAVHPQGLQQAVIRNKADVGFAFDGDGDRVIAIDRFGNKKDGDDILALLAMHPTYTQETTIVGTVMTNQGLEEHLKKHNTQLVRAAVGEKHILAEMLPHKYLLGGEPSGHIILQDYLAMSDGIAAALRILDAMHHTNNWDMVTFTKFPQVLINVPIKTRRDLTNQPLADLIATSETELGTGRILVRYSGTEPIIRVMAEAPNAERASTIAELLSQKLANELG